MTLRDIIDRGETAEVRGDGKAGGGLLMALESLGKALELRPSLHVEQWPLFSSSRKGAAVRAFMRIANHPIHTTAAVVHPHIAIAVDHSALMRPDFASGMTLGLFILNTHLSACEAAKTFHLRGTTLAINGDRIGETFFGHRIGNISVFASLVRASGYLSDEEGKHALADILAKRRLPQSVQEANLACYEESLKRIETVDMEGEESWICAVESFRGFPHMPIGAQSSLRTSLANKTAMYRPAGLRLTFSDSKHDCSGCALCLTNCPENIIDFVPDSDRGLRVTGANVVEFCKLCRECVEVCPAHLFHVEEVA